MLNFFFLLAFVQTAIVSGTFLPISLATEASSLETRQVQTRKCLQPAASIELHYIEEYNEDIPYVVRVTATHDQSAYVAVEKFEHLLADFSCSPRTQHNASTLSFAFENADSFAEARSIWGSHEDLLFVTHHTSCNEAEERAVYKSSVIVFDLENHTAVVTGRFVELGRSPEASSRLRLQGAVVNNELRRKLRRRYSLEDYSQVMKREVGKSDWVFDLNDLGRFDRRETIISFDQLNLACVDCTLRGKVGVHFDLDITLDRDLNPFNSAKLKLETIEALDGNFKIEVEAAIRGSAECSFPGTCKGSYKLGKKFLPTPSRRPSVITKIDVNTSLSLGVGVGVTWQASANVTFPVSVKASQGEISKDFFTGQATNTLDIKPSFGTPIINKDDAAAQVCGYVALGPVVALTASLDKFSMGVSARLDLPRLYLCAELTRNVDKSCNRGPFEQAIKLSPGIGAGLIISGTAKYDVPGPIDPSKKIDLSPNGLYKNWTIAPTCFDISGGQNGDKTIPQPGQPQNTSSPADPNFGVPLANTTNTGGNQAGAYDCAGVAPSPGGQPCGNVVMQCLDTSRWSCGNGQQGVVPPGTFCACGAFRYPGWKPPTAVTPSCTKGITCVSETLFSVCSPAGVEPPQAVSPGTKCRDGAIVAA